MSDDALPPAETRWEGRYIAVEQRGTWEYVRRARDIRAAVILAIEEQSEGRSVILVEQYRVPLGKRCIELPAGLIGDDDANEPAATAAARELDEETGYRAAVLSDAGEYYLSPGMVSESFTLFIARGLTRVHDGGGVEGENIVVHRVALPALPGFIAAKRAEGCGIDVKLLLLLGAGLIEPQPSDQRKLSA